MVGRHSLLSCHNSSEWTLIKSLRREQTLTENTHAHISRCDMKQTSAKEASRNVRIATFVQSYISSNPDKTLREIAFICNFVIKLYVIKSIICNFVSN